jgi:2-oxoglutarate dehydrogenase E1 component
MPDQASAALLSALNGGNATFIEQVYAQYQRAPESVDASWRELFDGLAGEVAAAKPSWARKDWPVVSNGELVSALDGNWPADVKPADKKAGAAPAAPVLSDAAVRAATLDSIRAIMLIRAYRMRGHLKANLDPLGLTPPKPHPEMEPASYGFGPEDMDRPIFIDNVLGLERASLREILEILQRTYCGTIGVEFMHISDPEEKSWIQQRIEGRGKEVTFTPEGKKAILKKLIEAEGFEKYCQIKFTGTKRFGLDGGESLIPALEQIIKRGGNLGVKEIVLGMPHRGRLNVLASVMGKPYHQLFTEFKGGSVTPDDVEGSGDVKYHLGTSSDREFDGNIVHLSLTANPSHLEAVNPVVIGKVRAKQVQRGDSDRTQVVPLLMHGDAAFAGQGMVAECFGMSGLKGHRTGGTIHVIVNNQIGFTTAPHYSRSSPYPSDVAKMVEAPIFHVNGDDPEAVVHVAKIATEFRQKFRKDVVIDIFCYRRFGHNETDDPAMTQPLMYRHIARQASTLTLYGDRLIAEGLVTAAEVEGWKAEFRARLDSESEAASGFKANKADWLEGKWAGFAPAKGEDRRGQTAVEMETLKRIGARLVDVPARINMHKTVRRFVDARAKAIDTGEGIDWATGEALAFGTLMDEGYPIRLCGQDSTRGTFVQRHSAYIDQETEERYSPLANLRPGQATWEVIDSMLSEEAVLGFEYGYSLAEPNTLVLWEAQFGDFANGAQMLVDQFISSSERKWLRMSGLVMLLPHGYEGQGPEHSSARLERYLQACAEDNMQVANCSTPANYFHILRRQIHREFRKPLILMTPKSLLRHKRCISSLSELATGSSFHRVLWDDAERLPDAAIKLKTDDKIKRVVLCTGKVYYDLYEEREKRGIDDIQILRVEQLYPFPHKSLAKELGRFPNADVVWAQEEPRNMGAYSFVEPNIEWVLNRIDSKAKRASYAGRPASASTATGLMSRHLAEQAQVLDDALTIRTGRKRKLLESDTPPTF